MNIADYTCPSCDQTSQAPLHRFAAGDAGIWVCPDCESAFRLQVDFVRITPATVDRALLRLREKQHNQIRQGTGIKGTVLHQLLALRQQTN